jgi:hypothetical protein
LDQQHAGRRVSGAFVMVVTFQLLLCGLGRQHGCADAVLLPIWTTNMLADAHQVCM